MLRTIVATCVLTVLACDGASSAARDSAKIVAAHADSVRADSIARARQDSINRAQPGYVVDSVFPVEEELRRFRNAIGGTAVTTLANASPSREELARRIVRAVAANDSAALRAAALTAREFADLMYPSSPYTHPPYRQAPGFVWMQIVNGSSTGFKRLLARRGGQRFDFESLTCKPEPERQEKNLLWLECTLRLVTPQKETVTQRWFGSIIERDGKFKIVSYANQF